MFGISLLVAFDISGFNVISSFEIFSYKEFIDSIKKTKTFTLDHLLRSAVHRCDLKDQMSITRNKEGIIFDV